MLNKNQIEMKLITKTAQRLELLKENTIIHSEAVDEIISFKNELKEIMGDKTIKLDKYKLRDIRQLIKEIEEVEK